MKNRRPEGFNKARAERCTTQSEDCECCECMSFNAGADAILEKLIEKGIKTDKFATNGRPIYLSNPRKKGWYVFIEK